MITIFKHACAGGLLINHILIGPYGADTLSICKNCPYVSALTFQWFHSLAVCPLVQCSGHSSVGQRFLCPVASRPRRRPSLVAGRACIGLSSEFWISTLNFYDCNYSKWNKPLAVRRKKCKKWNYLPRDVYNPVVQVNFWAVELVSQETPLLVARPPLPRPQALTLDYAIILWNCNLTKTCWSARACVPLAAGQAWRVGSLCIWTWLNIGLWSLWLSVQWLRIGTGLFHQRDCLFFGWW